MSPSPASEPRKPNALSDASPQFQGESKAQLWDGDPRIQKDGHQPSIISRPSPFTPAAIGKETSLCQAVTLMWEG